MELTLFALCLLTVLNSMGALYLYRRHLSNRKYLVDCAHQLLSITDILKSATVVKVAEYDTVKFSKEAN